MASPFGEPMKKFLAFGAVASLAVLTHVVNAPTALGG
jgi:hypothetical protein